jgi:AraC-like DNA-binding protein
MVAQTEHDRLDKSDKAVTGGVPKGVVDPRGAGQRIRLTTLAPSAALSDVIEYFWIVEWDRRGQAPATQRVLPYPNAHLVFENNGAAIHGVVRGAFTRVLEGLGRVLGARFYPGALRPWLDRPLRALTDRTVPADALLRCDAAHARVLAQVDDDAMVACADALLVAALPRPGARVQAQADLARLAVAAAAAAQGPVSVAALCAAIAVDERRLQRLFSDYVGVSPAWVIQRYRLQEAIWHLGQDPAYALSPDLADLAGRLGFFDQAHLTRHFTRLVGRSPRAYWRSQRQG